MSKNIRKILTEFYNLGEPTKKVLKYGIRFSLFLCLAGTVFTFINRCFLGYDLYLDFIGTSIIKNSVTVFAEVVIGCLIIDYAFSAR